MPRPHKRPKSAATAGEITPLDRSDSDQLFDEVEIAALAAILEKGAKTKISTDMLREQLPEVVRLAGLDPQDQRDPYARHFKEATKRAIATDRKQSERDRQHLKAFIDLAAGLKRSVDARLSRLLDRYLPGTVRRADQDRLGVSQRLRDGFIVAFLNDLELLGRTAAFGHRLLAPPRGALRTNLGLDEALKDLAELYCRITECGQDQHELSHAESSIFIQFADAVLNRFLPAPRGGIAGDDHRKALARRWERLKRDRLAVLKPPKPSQT